MASIRFLSEITEGDRDLVGGKMLSLGRLAAAGLPVPSGFCITAGALESGVRVDGTLSPDLAREIAQARRRLGAPALAVRSSAVFEDAETASFAGQLETILGVRSDEELLGAVGRCWQAGHSARVAAYRRKQTVQTAGPPDSQSDSSRDSKAEGVAIVVQSLVEADVAGVLFTVDAASGRHDRMLIESAWGLGESVVSGAVNPDRFVLDRNRGAVVEQHLSDKAAMRTSSKQVNVPEERRRQPSLTAEQIAALAALGRRIESIFGCPQDIEWAIAAGEVFLLQSRPITTLPRGPAVGSGLPEETETLCRQEIGRLRTLSDPRGTIWSSYNISEVLPEPCPMTWALAAELMSGRGGLGLAYRDLGFIPSREVDEKGILDLICGRPYVNLRRETQMYLAEFPYEHDFARIKANPSQASYPTPRLNLAGATGRFWWRLPYLATRMILSHARLARTRKDFDRRLNGAIFPRFAEWAAVERQSPLDGLSDSELLERFRTYHRRVMVDFVCEALKATIVAGLAYANLKRLLEQHLGEEATHYLAALASGERADVTVEMDEAIWRVGCGETALGDFLAAYGHRGVGEFELARPRWREDPQQIERLAHLSVRRGERSPLELCEGQRHHHERLVAELAQRLKRIGGAARDRIERETATLRRYMPFRESVKHYWMMGYELLRRCLLEIDRRHELRGGVFYLTPDELPPLIAKGGTDFREIIEGRRRRRDFLLRIPVPQVLFSDDLEAIGRPHEPAAGAVLEGVGVSGGVATGIARVLLEPTDLGEQESGYVLVCPSTDPGWTPLFARARALVIERGGVLSHGAIVAREYGLPAVVNVPDATLRIAVGRHVRVDGGQGKVWLL